MPNRFVLATIVWVLFITYMCLVSASKIPTAAWFVIPHKDKVVHFVFYFVLTLLLYKDFKLKWGVLKKSFAFAFITAVSYGVLIEICQWLFRSGRNAEILDVIANTSGSAFGILILWLRQKLKK